MHYVMALAAIMVAAWFAWPTASIPIVAKAVTPENVREHRVDEGTFRSRWSTVNDLPPATVYEPLLIVSHEQSARRTLTRKVSLRRSNICSRHGMRRVVTRGGRSWRCRR